MRESNIDRLVGLAFWTLSVLCLLNVNGLIRMWGGGERAASGVMLFCCLVALAGLTRIGPRSALGTPGALILCCMMSYAGIGILVTTLSGAYPEPHTEWWYLVRYANSALLILAVAVSGGVLWRRVGGERVMFGILLIMAGSCALVLVSPWLSSVLAYRPGAGDYRFFGAFADPNEAGLMACFTVAVALAVVGVERFRGLAYGALAVAVPAVVGTFSRTALLTLPIVLVGSLWASGGVQRKRVAVILGLVCVITVGAVASLDADRFDERQVSRWRSLLTLVDQADPDDLALAGRSVLWGLALEQTLEAPLHGNGLGRLHQLDGAWYSEDGDLLGAHNQYLILGGEAGFLPLALFVLFLAVTLRAGFGKNKTWPLVAVSGWSICLIVFSMAFHGVLTYRFCNFVIGLICAISAGWSRDEDLAPRQRSRVAPM